MEKEWVIRVEKKLTSIQKDVEYIKDKMPVDENHRIKSMIKTNRWIMSILFTTTGAILGAVISKL